MLGLASVRMILRAQFSLAKRGHFENEHNYALRPVAHNLWLYDPGPGPPLTFVRHDGWKMALADRFETDLASAPRIVWWIPDLAPTDMLPSALFHDRLYDLNHLQKPLLDRAGADRLLEEMLLSQTDPSYSRCEAFAIREAVELFGQAVWDGSP